MEVTDDEGHLLQRGAKSREAAGLIVRYSTTYNGAKISQSTQPRHDNNNLEYKNGRARQEVTHENVKISPSTHQFYSSHLYLLGHFLGISSGSKNKNSMRVDCPSGFFLQRPLG